MKLIDHAPYVLHELIKAGGELNSTQLTEAVFGTSGRGSPKLVNSLFPFCIRRGWVTLTKRGRSHVYPATDLARALLAGCTSDDDVTARWDATLHTFKG